ncbi:venom serine carboxypeptidase-like isoform X2 [Dermacentor albipictus]|uniref:venom serine carboxypeptidase-like isoform X2 n=1 Tax=Dermacentor albipictus TaxID=60249 RepID=UPI0038FC46A5
MKLHQFSNGVLISAAILTVSKCDTEDGHHESSFVHTETATPHCAYINEAESNEDLLLYPTNDRIPREQLLAMRLASRVCLPKPCDNLKAFSGFIPVNDDKTSYLFFLLIKATHTPWDKPLLLWLQGGPGKSSLFGQFLENGPLGINASGTLYHRHHTLVKQFHVIYLDQPVGSGYSFDTGGRYPSTLEEASIHIMRFLRRFLRLFPEYYGRSFYIAGESYGAFLRFTKQLRRPPLALAGRRVSRGPWSGTPGSLQYLQLALTIVASRPTQEAAFLPESPHSFIAFAASVSRTIGYWSSPKGLDTVPLGASTAVRGSHARRRIPFSLARNNQLNRLPVLHWAA